MRRFAAGMRAVVAMLCTLLLFGSHQAPGAAAAAVLLGYGMWSALVLWREASVRPLAHAPLHYWVDVAWTGAMLHLTTGFTPMFVLTLVQPVVIASIGYGVRHGVQLAAFAALTVALDTDGAFRQALGEGPLKALPALVVLALVPAAALIARPMSVLRQRLALLADIETTLDPRRGLQAVTAQLVQGLRAGTGAQVVGFVPPSATGAPATLGTAEEGSFNTSAEVHRQLESLLAHTPEHPVTHVRRRRWRPTGGMRVLGGGPALAGLRQGLDAVAALLDVHTLVVVPITRYQRRHGHLLLGLAGGRSHHQDATALAHAAPELLRVVEQAALVDQLQQESENHERARIGRDLHDSAIQPYLGLKFAVECVALRVPRDNPARAEVDALAELVNGEVAALRELISGLRTGSGTGDSPLVPAVRRQVRRFALLFGIEVELDCPDTLVTTRALADALFHLVNESLNNLRKHSAARHVWIRLALEESSTVRLTVRDDAGTVLGQPVAPFRPASLSERVAELGGSLHISQPDGLNTEIVMLIPL
jgi:signal transduction histidine kinase